MPDRIMSVPLAVSSGDQLRLRRRIAVAKEQQAMRRRLVEQKKADLDAILEYHDRRITNLEQQLTIGVAP